MRGTKAWACGAALMVSSLLVNFPAGASESGAAGSRPLEYRTGDLVVTEIRSRPTPPVASVGAVYFSITNAGRKADLLIAVSTPIARNTEIHESRLVQGVVEMRPVASVACPPGVTVKVEPGGLHVMLLGLSRPLVAGTQFPLSLRFREAGTLTVQVPVVVEQ